MSETRKFLIPAFGPLQGIRVLCFGSYAAAPWATTLLAEYGAEAIQIERPGYGNPMRFIPPILSNPDNPARKAGANWVQMQRNSLNIELNVKMDIADSREAFLDLVKISDIFIENIGDLNKYGVTEEALLDANPSLTIVHGSGYGKPEFGGDPAVQARPSFDLMGQAYSAYLNLQGSPDPDGPTQSQPFINDLTTGLVLVIGALAGYVNAKATGKGQVIDVSQYEAQAMCLADTFVTYSVSGWNRTRTGGWKQPHGQPYGCYRASDGWVAVVAYGATFPKFLDALELDKERYEYSKVAGTIEIMQTPLAREFNDVIEDWVSQRTVNEVVQILSDAGVAASPVHTAKSAMEDPHWIDRESVMTWHDEMLDMDVKGFGLCPKFGGTPTRIWRGSPTLGQDTVAVFKELLGYDDEHIKRLADQGITRIPE